MATREADLSEEDMDLGNDDENEDFDEGDEERDSNGEEEDDEKRQTLLLQVLQKNLEKAGVNPDAETRQNLKASIEQVKDIPQSSWPPQLASLINRFNALSSPQKSPRGTVQRKLFDFFPKSPRGTGQLKISDYYVKSPKKSPVDPVSNYFEKTPTPKESEVPIQKPQESEEKSQSQPETTAKVEILSDVADLQTRGEEQIADENEDEEPTALNDETKAESADQDEEPKVLDETVKQTQTDEDQEPEQEPEAKESVDEDELEPKIERMQEATKPEPVMPKVVMTKEEIDKLLVALNKYKTTYATPPDAESTEKRTKWYESTKDLVNGLLVLDTKAAQSEALNSLVSWFKAIHYQDFLHVQKQKALIATSLLNPPKTKSQQKNEKENATERAKPTGIPWRTDPVCIQFYDISWPLIDVNLSMSALEIQQHVQREYGPTFTWPANERLENACDGRKEPVLNPIQRFVTHYMHPWQNPELKGEVLVHSAGSGKSATAGFCGSTWARHGYIMCYVGKPSIADEIPNAQILQGNDVNLQQWTRGKHILVKCVEWLIAIQPQKKALAAKRENAIAALIACAVDESEYHAFDNPNSIPSAAKVTKIVKDCRAGRSLVHLIAAKLREYQALMLRVRAMEVKESMASEDDEEEVTQTKNGKFKKGNPKQRKAKAEEADDLEDSEEYENEGDEEDDETHDMLNVQQSDSRQTETGVAEKPITWADQMQQAKAIYDGLGSAEKAKVLKQGVRNFVLKYVYAQMKIGFIFLQYRQLVVPRVSDLHQLVEQHRIIGNNYTLEEVKLDPWRKCVLLIDETHFITQPGAGTAREDHVDMANLQRVLQNSYSVSGVESVRSIAMTATPIVEHPLDLFSQVALYVPKKRLDELGLDMSGIYNTGKPERDRKTGLIPREKPNKFSASASYGNADPQNREGKNRRQAQDTFMDNFWDPESNAPKPDMEANLTKLLAGRVSVLNLVGDLTRFAQPLVEYHRVHMTLFQQLAVADCVLRAKETRDKTPSPEEAAKLAQQAGILTYNEQTGKLNINPDIDATKAWSSRPQYYSIVNCASQFSLWPNMLSLNTSKAKALEGQGNVSKPKKPSKKTSSKATRARGRGRGRGGRGRGRGRGKNVQEEVVEQESEVEEPEVEAEPAQNENVMDTKGDIDVGQWKLSLDDVISMSHSELQKNFPTIEAVSKYSPIIAQLLSQVLYIHMTPELRGKQYIYVDLDNRHLAKKGIALIMRFLSLSYKTDHGSTDAFVLVNSQPKQPIAKNQGMVMLDSSKGSAAIKPDLVDRFNHPDNLHGENIMLFLNCGKYKEGMSLYGVQHAHMVGYMRTLTDLVQATARAIRNCSPRGLSFEHVDKTSNSRKPGWAIRVHMYTTYFGEDVGVDVNTGQLTQPRPTANDLINLFDPRQQQVMHAIEWCRALLYRVACDAFLAHNINRKSQEIESRIHL